MKYLVHAGLIAGLLFATSCKKGEEKKEEVAEKKEEVAKPKPEEMVAKEWLLGDMQMEVFNEKMKKAMEKNKAKMDKEIEEMKKESYYNFNKDGSYAMKQGKQEEKGKWSVSDNKLITIRDKEGAKPDTIDIATIDDSQLVLTKGDSTMKMTMKLTPKK